MKPYGAEHLLESMAYRPPEPDPIANRVEAALDAGLVTEAHAAIEALDALEGDTDREPESDGGSVYPEDTGLAVNEYLATICECPCCGHSHNAEPILIA